MKCRCGCSPSWICWGRTDVSNKPRRASKLTLYPSPVLSEKAAMNIKPHRTCFAMPFCVCHLDIQPGKESENGLGMQSRSAALRQGSGHGTCSGQFYRQHDQTSYGFFKQRAPGLFILLVPQRKKTGDPLLPSFQSAIKEYGSWGSLGPAMVGT